METVTVLYPETKLASGEVLPEDEFYFASEDGEHFYELTRLPESGESLPEGKKGFKRMSFARRYFDMLPTERPGVKVKFGNVK